MSGKEEIIKCDCCEFTYSANKMVKDGQKNKCLICDEECPCGDSKCGSVCPAKEKMVAVLATRA